MQTAQVPSPHDACPHNDAPRDIVCRGGFIAAMIRAAALLVILGLSHIVAPGQAGPPRKIVVDASNDGGSWWSPQRTGAFDPKNEHQGKRFADYLRSRGWEVEEIGRGEDITERLKGAAIVIRAGAALDCKASEAHAYRDYVAGGGNVLLLRGFVREGTENGDKIAKEFGIVFSKTARAATIKRWGTLPLTQGLDLLQYHVGSVVTESPKGMLPLAYLDDDQLVGGIVRQGKGKVLFLSTILPMLQVPKAFIDRILEEFTPM